jgi:ribosomal protein S18 acetylase RimI-like enzyme
MIYRNATADDAPALTEIFRQSFCETFGHLYRAADLSAFLAGQSERHWSEQLADDTFAVRVAEQDMALAGYAKLGPLRLPVTPAGAALELRQFSLLKQWQGAGIASGLMDWVLEEARRRGARKLYLSVYTDNPRAQRFYARYGFEEVGPYAFMVGAQADEDVIMKLQL